MGQHGANNKTKIAKKKEFLRNLFCVHRSALKIYANENIFLFGFNFGYIKLATSRLWRDDLVVFALGCSFSFEEALLADGLDVRNVSEGVNVPMYRTNIDCAPAGPFQGKMVVSMRPFKAADAIRAVQICTRFPSVHGAPIHLGDPGLIGIENLDLPDYGDAVTLAEDELPVFWACGVTPQVALEEAKPPFAITHSPGHMLVTDLRNSQLAVL